MFSQRSNIPGPTLRCWPRLSRAWACLMDGSWPVYMVRTMASGTVSPSGLLVHISAIRGAFLLIRYCTYKSFRL